MNEDQLDKLWKRIKPLKIAMLTSKDGDVLRARPMWLVQDDFDGALWFFTRLSSHKSVELNHSNQVCLSFCSEKDNTFVSLSGIASLTQSREKIDEFWSEAVSVWFPDGRDSGDVALIKVDIQQAEYWDGHGVVKQVYEFIAAKVASRTPDLGDHEKIQ